MRYMTRATLAALFTQSLLSCAERPLPLQPTVPGPAFQIQDAVHNSGNRHFFFLPPLVPQPRYSGVFDATESPVITLCRWTGTACSTIVAQLSMTSGTGSQVVRVDLAGQAYSVNWDSNQCLGGPCRFAAGDVLRLRVLVAGTELGHADAKLVADQQQAKNVDNSEFVPLIIGKTLTIKFRIEQGAVFVVGSSGGTITALGGQVTLVVPPGALSENVGITVAPAATVPTVPHLVPGTAFDFGPSGTTFPQAVQLTIKYDPAHVPATAREAALRLHKVVDNIWQPVVGSSVNTGTTSVTGSISSFSSYAAVSFTWSTISAGGYYDFSATCGLSGGLAYCWGNNSVGQLGTGSNGGPETCSSGAYNDCSTTPLAVIGTHTFQSVSVGGDTTKVCGLDTGEAYCWGAGPVGNSSIWTSPSPVAVSGGFTFLSVVAGHQHNCGITTDHLLYCWGDWYQHTQVQTPTQVGDALTWQSVSPALHDCGVAGNVPYCWGSNERGQLGDGSTNNSETPVAVSGSFELVTAGRFHSCGLSGGAAYCWGDNDFGELGSGSSVGPESCLPYSVNCSLSPVSVTGGLSFQSVSPGSGFTCGLTLAGDVYCWGTGPLGNSSTSSSATPVLVAGGLKFVQVSSVGTSHACGVTDIGLAFCWGSNQSGQLGDGSTTSSLVPVEVKTP